MQSCQVPQVFFFMTNSCKSRQPKQIFFVRAESRWCCRRIMNMLYMVVLNFKQHQHSVNIIIPSVYFLSYNLPSFFINCFFFNYYLRGKVHEKYFSMYKKKTFICEATTLDIYKNRQFKELTEEENNFKLRFVARSSVFLIFRGDYL